MATIFDLSQDDFFFALDELGLPPEQRDELIRQYRSQNSVLAPLNRAADESQAAIAGEGRRPVAGGLLSKPEGATGIDALRGLRLEPMSGLLGMLTGAGRAVEAPAAAAQGLIPEGDMVGEALGTAGLASLGGSALTRPAGSVGVGGRVAAADFDVTRRDASNIFGEGSERVRYTDPNSGGTMEVVVRPDGRASVLELEVPESFRGQGIGQSLQSRVMQDFPVMGGQVSSKAAATTAYRLGRRPYGMPDATLEDVFRIMDEDSSVNLISPASQPTELSANRSTATGLLALAAETPAQRVAREILDLRAAGRASEVTDEMMARADPQYMFDNTPLPMDEASRLARAGAAGFDTGVPLYRGDPQSMRQSFDTGTGARANIGVTSSTSPNVAATYMTGDNPMMFPIFSRSANELSLDAQGRNWTGIPADARANASRLDEILNVQAYLDEDNLFDYNSPAIDWGDGSSTNMAMADTNSVSRAAQEAGFDQVRFRNIVDRGGAGRFHTGPANDPQTTVMTANPANVRSRFARFDPEFAHLSNLNAANANPLLGLFAMMAAQEQRNGQ